MQEAPARKRVALVIGSGGVKCAAALGLQEAFADAGIPVDLVVGCSAGSIFATAAALGWSTARATEVTLRLWTAESAGKTRRLAILQAAFPRLFRFGAEFGFRDDRRLRARLRDAFGEATFAAAGIPLFITATDFHTGEQVILRDGLLREAMRASIALPFVFAPCRVGDRLLMDGFLSDPVPVNVAMQEGAGIIIAMGFESPQIRRLTSPMRLALQLTGVMSNNLLRSRFAFHNLSHHSEVIPILPDFQGQRVNIFDATRLPFVIEEGRRVAQAHIPYLRRLLAEGLA
jgi:NTE family protein